MEFLIIVALIIVVLGLRVIRTKEVGIIERLGRFTRILTPGLNWIIPFIDKLTFKTQLRTQSLKMYVDSVAHDNVKVRIGIDVLFYIKEDKDSVYKSFYSLGNPLSAIQSIVDNALRSKINEFDHLDILAKRNEFSEYLEDILKAKLVKWGYTLDSVQMTDIELPEDLIAAMNSVKTSERQKEAALNEGEAKKILAVKDAEGDQESKRLQGLGIAQQREEVAKGLKNSVEEFRQALGTKSDPNEIMNIILMTNYFDTLKSIGEGPNAKVIMMDGTPEGLKSVKQQIIAGIQSTQK
jgi:regulator of protease activity HflC (stomatin/prohibitin superfamily)